MLVALLLALPVRAAEPRPAAVFSAPAAWAEFTRLLRENYGYLQRLGVDGAAILAHFAPQALAAPDRDVFIDVLQLIAHNFVDPHFVVGPLSAADMSVIPTNADLHARFADGRATIVDVRTDSAAEAAGLRPGDTITRIDGQAPTAAIERVMGRPLADLSPVQIDGGLDIALGGSIAGARSLAVTRDGSTTVLTLPPTEAFAKAVAARPPLTFVRRGDVAIIRFNNSLGRDETIAAFRDAVAKAVDARVLVIDLRNTPSGGTTTIARAIMGHVITHEAPYQVHTVPHDARVYGVPRKFIEYVAPQAPHFPGKVVVLGDHWTGSMGEGMMVGFDAMGIRTAGARLGGLLGALFNEDLAVSGARVDLGEEELFHVDGRRREDFLPKILVGAAEAHGDADPLLDKALAALR